ncbi:MAG TPA: toll/interleukin-1 receptor domain-containing protein [Candidatus Acidoferrales bacterium]|jgi:hypothetical protein|nr:toll/interleukin-1 receptor domain-containing protein [Candidatus Acidoferrales bacterium]
MPDRNSAEVLDRGVAPTGITDLSLCHNAVDATWSQQLAERIRGELGGNRRFVTPCVGWNFSSATDILAEAKKFLLNSRFFGLVISARMLQEDWPTLGKLISVLSDSELAKGRFVTILKENVTMPPPLRLHEWIDFRDGHRFEDSICDLLTLLREDLASPVRSPRRTIGTSAGELTAPAWKTRPLFLGARKVTERIVSNLFPVVEIPKDIFSAETPFQTESEIMEACGGPGPLPFLLKGSRLYAAAPITEKSVFGPAMKGSGKPSQDRFTHWVLDPERAPWAIQLLNHLLRYHAWRRGLRFDEGQSLFYFTRSKPKNLWWEIGGKTIQREVTAPHSKWSQTADQAIAEFQCGWRHEAIRAGFIQVLGGLFLRLEPAWFLTELDGKTPATTRPIGPLESFPSNQERNGQVLRTLRFWSAVFAKGHRELRMETGTNPIRVRLTPASGSSPSVISNDQMDFDALALTDIDHPQLIPDLGPVELS